MKNIFKKVAMALSSLTVACSPAATNTPEKPETPESPAVFAWSNPLEYEYIDEDYKQLKKYSKIIEQNLKKNEIASPVFRLGNLMFFEIKHAPNTVDAIYQYRAAAVGLPDAYYDMPNHSLFKTFSEAMRHDLNLLESYIWIKAMIILSTGNPRYLQMPENAPTWNDKDGQLEIIYYRLRSNGMAAETKEKCILSIDATQLYNLNCQEVTPE